LSRDPSTSLRSVGHVAAGGSDGTCVVLDIRKELIRPGWLLDDDAGLNPDADPWYGVAELATRGVTDGWDDVDDRSRFFCSQLNVLPLDALREVS
jgi:hypothetical protein